MVLLPLCLPGRPEAREGCFADLSRARPEEVPGLGVGACAILGCSKGDVDRAPSKGILMCIYIYRERDVDIDLSI